MHLFHSCPLPFHLCSLCNSLLFLFLRSCCFYLQQSGSKFITIGVSLWSGVRVGPFSSFKGRKCRSTQLSHRLNETVKGKGNNKRQKPGHKVSHRHLLWSNGLKACKGTHNKDTRASLSLSSPRWSCVHPSEAINKLPLFTLCLSLVILPVSSSALCLLSDQQRNRETQGERRTRPYPLNFRFGHPYVTVIAYKGNFTIHTRMQLPMYPHPCPGTCSFPLPLTRVNPLLNPNFSALWFLVLMLFYLSPSLQFASSFCCCYCALLLVLFMTLSLSLSLSLHWTTVVDTDASDRLYYVTTTAIYKVDLGPLLFRPKRKWEREEPRANISQVSWLQS